MELRVARVAPIVALIAGLLAVPASAGAGCPSASSAAAQLSADQAQDAIRCLINKERDGREMKKLRQRDSLEGAAHFHATDMAVNGYFSHTSRDGSSAFDRAVAFGYVDGRRDGGVAEVIGAGGPSFTPAGLVEAWMASGIHRRVLLEPILRHIGVGMAYVNGQSRYVADLGYR